MQMGMCMRDSSERVSNMGMESINVWMVDTTMDSGLMGVLRARGSMYSLEDRSTLVSLSVTREMDMECTFKRMDNIRDYGRMGCSMGREC